MSSRGWQIDVDVCGDPCARVTVVGIHLTNVCDRFEKCFADYASLAVRSDQPFRLDFCIDPSFEV